MSEALNTRRINGLAQVRSNHRLRAQILGGLVFLFDSKSRKRLLPSFICLKGGIFLICGWLRLFYAGFQLMG